MRQVRMPGGALQASAADLLLQLRHIHGERSDRIGRRNIARLLARAGGVLPGVKDGAFMACAPRGSSR